MRTLLWVALAACGGPDDPQTTSSPPADTDADADADADTDTDADADADAEHGNVWNEPAADGMHTVVAALDAADPVHFSFATVDRVEPSGDWDMAFARFAIAVNGGVSGDGNVAVTRLEGVELAALHQAPAGPWETDAPDSDGDGTDQLALLDWYDYDPTTHQLTAADRVYVLTTSVGPVALAFTGYTHEETGTSGYVGFTWKVVDPASPRLTHTSDGDALHTVVDATSETDWVTLDLATRTDPRPADPSADPSWDLAFRRTEILVNGGSSGPGAVEVAWLEGVDLDEVDAAPAAGFATDGEGQPVMGSWYDYDFVTHTVIPKPGTYVVRDEAGAWAVQLVAYDDGAGTTGLPTFRWKAVTP